MYSMGVAAVLAATLAPAASARAPLSGDEAVQQFRASRVANADKSPSGQLAQSDAGLMRRTDSRLVAVMVKLDVDAAASYAGGVNGFAATSPSVTGQALQDNGAAVAAYRNYVNQQAILVQRGVQRVVPTIRIGNTFTLAYGGFAAQLPANRAKDLLRVPGVAAVQYDALNHPTANDSPIFVGATQVWPSLGGSLKAGQGIKVGVIDTGIWPEHPMLRDPGIPRPPGGPYDCDFGKSGKPHDANFSCNDKLVGAYAFLDTNLLVTGPAPNEYCPTKAKCSARDAEGHGTHTATTAAGSRVDHAVLFGVDYGEKSGIAPGASVIAYRVCDVDGCYESDSMAAVEQSIIDDVDVINFSISGGKSAYTDALELAFLDAYAAGIAVNASAGNDGPGAGTSDHAGPWVNTVGASTLNREFGTSLRLAAGSNTRNISGVTITAGITNPTQVVLAKTRAGYNDELCSTPADPGTFTGKVVACERGVVARVEKGYNVLQGGAVGMILYNVGVTDVETDNHYLPTIHLNDPSQTIEAFVTNNPNARASWPGGVPRAAQGDVMADFSSRGPLGDFIKPDVTAPGVQIFAGASPQHVDDPAEGLGPDGQLYQAIAGTSMSGPHAAGVAALLKAAHPSWTPGQIKSAMMTSSLQSVLKEDFATPADPFDRGAGSIRVNRAINPTITFDVAPYEFFASADDELNRINLNLPSIYSPQMDGTITATRTVRNVSGVTQTIDLKATKKPGKAGITFSPSTFTVGAGDSATFTVTISAAQLANGLYFGEVTLDPRRVGANNAVMPVAFRKAPGEVTLTNRCNPPGPAPAGQRIDLNRGQTADCTTTATNFTNQAAHVQLGAQAPAGNGLVLRNWSAGNRDGNGFVWNGTLAPALAPPIESITAPGYGYVSMPGIGALPESAFGIDYTDETIVTYTGLPPFSYGGEVYDELSVDSNGYVIVGGDITDADNNCCDPQMPDPARPNNVLAPYWTDLNPEAGGEVYLALVGDYLVVEWRRIPVFGTTNQRTFQVWIATTSAEEDISFEYCVSPNNREVNPSTGEWGCNDSAPAQMGAGSPDGLLVGAENRDGTSAATIGPLNTRPTNRGYVVDAGVPTAGGSKTISYDAFGGAVGTYDVRARMSSDVTPGTTIEIVRIRVVNP